MYLRSGEVWRQNCFHMEIYFNFQTTTRNYILYIGNEGCSFSWVERTLLLTKSLFFTLVCCTWSWGSFTGIVGNPWILYWIGKYLVIVRNASIRLSMLWGSQGVARHRILPDCVLSVPWDLRGQGRGWGGVGMQQSPLRADGSSFRKQRNRQTNSLTFHWHSGLELGRAFGSANSSVNSLVLDFFFYARNFAQLF